MAVLPNKEWTVPRVRHGLHGSHHVLDLVVSVTTEDTRHGDTTFHAHDGQLNVKDDVFGGVPGAACCSRAATQGTGSSRHLGDQEPDHLQTDTQIGGCWYLQDVM